MRYIVWVMAMVMITAIVFVQAQKLGGTSGGDQVSKILKAAGGSLSSLTSSLETGQYNAVS